MRECYRQGQTEVVSNSRNTIHQTWGPPFSRSLHMMVCGWQNASAVCHVCGTVARANDQQPKSRHVEGGGNRACVILISRGEGERERALHHPATRDPTREYWISIEFRGRVNRQNRWTTDNMGDDVLKEETIILPSSP